MKTRKILIVDDDTFSRGAMEKLLESYNYETFSCALVEEAIARLQQESFNILITDLQMPGMDGFELIRNARMIQPRLLTIMTTGFSTEEVKCKAKGEKLDGFFSKPVNWDELYTLLDVLSETGKVQNKDMSRNIRKEKGPSLPQRIFFALILFLFTALNAQPLRAQQPFPKQSKPILKIDRQGTGWQSFLVDLTEEQAKAIENLQRTYAAEVLALRIELISLRFELRHLIRDPNVQSKILLDRQKKILELQTKHENLSFSFQLKLREILTKEQLESLPQDYMLGTETVYGIGKGVDRDRGLQKGTIWRK